MVEARSYRIELTSRAAKELERLPKPIQKRIARWLDILAADPRCEGSKQLEGKGHLRRVHAGKDYVIVYRVLDDVVVVLVVRIAHRREAYRML
ncbi:MAG: type II toxin-antitoxin system mRNA interferase toxin, RelE/StbE family [Candidatus Bipolaricaulota bacterium]|nr:type II toxin-antitoxin system mRNA interferase toxin, RelE/StbE family [Candidatus Bipolaricaulota bacterium]